MQRYLQWLQDGLERPGKSQVGLAKHLGWNESQVSRMVNGERALRASEIEVIESYLEVPYPRGATSGGEMEEEAFDSAGQELHMFVSDWQRRHDLRPSEVGDALARLVVVFSGPAHKKPDTTGSAGAGQRKRKRG